MSATRRDLLAGWRAYRAARAAEAAAAVTTVTTASGPVVTPGEARKSAVVTSVTSVTAQNGKDRIAPAPRDVWGLSDADKAEAMARLFGSPAKATAEGMDNDAAERAAMAAHYADEGAAHPYQPGDPDVLRDGLAEGFRRHHRRAAP